MYKTTIAIAPTTAPTIALISGVEKIAMIIAKTVAPIIVKTKCGGGWLGLSELPLDCSTISSS